MKEGVICVQILLEIHHIEPLNLVVVESISKVEQLCLQTRLSCSVPILVTTSPPPPALQRKVSMAALQGAMHPSITCLGHSNVVSNCKFYIGLPA